MPNSYSEKSVFEESLDRIRWLFDEFPDVIVAMSGGKDSTVCFELSMMVAKEKGRLPLKVYWLDQEAEWQHTVDYMSRIMNRDDVEPYWFQIPFDFTNSLSNENNYLRVWDEAKKDLWIHPKSEIAIHDNPTKYNRFHDIIVDLPNHCTDADSIAVIVGMRADESTRRRMAVSAQKAKYKGENWCSARSGKSQKFWPIWDWSFSDVWVAIAKNHWEYNELYDLMYRYGQATNRMRVSALIHETATHHIGELQQFEPKTYNKFCRRVAGTNAMNHALETSLIPKKLPFAFRDWEEYRDYLLEHIVKEEYREHFRKEWQGQDDEDWYRVHVRECIIQDIDGTLNANHLDARRLKAKKKELYGA